MEIRTLLEIQAGNTRMTRETTVTTGPGETESEAAKVLDQAERAGKVPALEAQVLDLMAENKRVSDWAHNLEVNVGGLTAERDALLLRVREYDNDQKTEKQRADENWAWAERTEDHLETRTRELDKATEKLARIQDKVWKDTLDHAMNHRGDPESISIETVGDLVYAVSAVRSIVGQP